MEAPEWGRALPSATHRENQRITFWMTSISLFGSKGLTNHPVAPAARPALFHLVARFSGENQNGRGFELRGFP
jgi:hypothetical protein